MDGSITESNTRIIETAKLSADEAVTYKDLSTIWKFESRNNGAYYWLRNLNTGLIVSKEDGTLLAVDNEESSAQLVLEEVPGNAQQWLLKNSSKSDSYLNAKNGAEYETVGFFNRNWGSSLDGGNIWYIEEAQDVKVDITAVGWATLCLPFEVNIPSGVTAYIAGESNGNYLPLTALEGVIPTNEPVLLEGAEGTYTFTINTTATATKSGTNTLSGTTVKRTGFSTETAEYMALANKDAGVGLYQSLSANIPANKAYYEISNGGADVNALQFRFGDETTGIESVTNAGADEVFYDLNGRRVTKPTRGIYVTGNGKKVFFIK